VELPGIEPAPENALNRELLDRATMK
jgi:hypothetical protein